MEEKECKIYVDNNASFLSLDLSDCLDSIVDITRIKSESLSSEYTFLQSCGTKKESLIEDKLNPSYIESFNLNDIYHPGDVLLISNDCIMSSSDGECDIANMDMFTSETRIRDLLDMHSPNSMSSSHHSLLEGLSVDSRPSTIHTLSTNPSINELCTICNDLASGKHYGVYACEGCKGFFKRTIRKKLAFTCREFDCCPVTEKLRNRCQACRYKRCIEKGMKVEAVQKERPCKRKLSLSDSSVSCPESVITADSIYKNELSCSNVVTDKNESVEVEETRLLCSIINKQLFQLVMWAKSVPGFGQLDRSDQMILLNKSWVDIFLASVAFRSTFDSDLCSVKMDDTYRLTLSVAAKLGLQHLIVRIIRELISTLKCMHVDQMEMACLKIIILFDSNYADLKDPQTIRCFRLSVFDILKKYVVDKFPTEPSRIYKLLLKLSSIRGLTSCFVQKMGLVLHDCLLSEDISSPSTSESNSEILFPLFNEMMSQQDFPFA